MSIDVLFSELISEIMRPKKKQERMKIKQNKKIQGHIHSEKNFISFLPIFFVQQICCFFLDYHITTYIK